MKTKPYFRYWLLALAGCAALSLYPFMMGVRVTSLMHTLGYVPFEQYPKYVIPYTPLAIALIIGVHVMPPAQRFLGRLGLPAGAALSAAVFFIFERIMESKILVQTTTAVPLESWQLSLCIMQPQLYESRTWEAVDVLLGGYKPSFKLHFYLIALVLLVSMLGCIYGFGRMILTGDKSKTRRKALTIESIATAVFLGMCIWACFTAFYRGGELAVPTVSAVLMAVFFLLLGLVVGAFSGALTLGKPRFLSIWLPAILASLTVLLMYIGELLLLNGTNLYLLGSGWFFEPLPAIVLAPADIAIILAAGLLTALIFAALNKRESPAE